MLRTKGPASLIPIGLFLYGRQAKGEDPGRIVWSRVCTSTVKAAAFLGKTPLGFVRSREQRNDLPQSKASKPSAFFRCESCVDP